MKSPRHRLQPLVIDAKEAHQQMIVTYDVNGDLILNYQDIKRRISADHQYPIIFAAFQDLNKALSHMANSPFVKGAKTLRQQFDEEYNLYIDLLDREANKGVWEPDYGSYVFDPLHNNIYLVLPEKWHRLGLVTNTAKLLTDSTGTYSWQKIRELFDNTVIGVVGASVGGNILEGVMREVRPKRIKIADPDWIELTNLNRLERGGIQYLVKSRAAREDITNHYDIPRFNKAEICAYQQQMVDPYADIYTYADGIHAGNISKFLLGDDNEPKIDILIEEMDDIRLKVEIRELCRIYKIPVLMLSDFGHLVQCQFQNYSKGSQTLGYQCSDAELKEVLAKAVSSGNREDRFELIRLLCGNEFNQDEFGLWVKGEGEQPTSSLPQSGATALATGGVGGKMIALHILGHTVPERFIFDLAHQSICQ